MGKYALFFEADLLFGVNIFLILTILSLMFVYADKRGILTEDIMKGKKNAYNTFLIVLIITAAVTLLNYLIPGHYIYLYLLIPIISSVRDRIFRKHVWRKKIRK